MRNGGLIRAQICILGGAGNSGAFKYLIGSHKLNVSEPFPKIGYLEENKNNLLVCDKPNGSLFLINTIGYHSKCVCNNTRISLMFDFLPEDYIIKHSNDVSSEIHLTSSRLTDKVLNHIHLFKNGVNSGTKSSNTADYSKFDKFFSGANLNELISACVFFIRKKLNRSSIN